MNAISASAPGKLLLFGEYAVLAGAWAWVAAVDRRVQVTLTPVGIGESTIDAPQLDVHQVRCDWSHADLRLAPEHHARLGMTARLLPLLAESLDLDIELLSRTSLRIDSAALFESDGQGCPVKLGLGSSGAVTAALIAAFEALAGIGDPSDSDARLNRCLPLYRKALASPVSGADLAASLGGGLQRYIDDARGPRRVPASWPEGLSWQPVWVGQAAQTIDFVGVFRKWQHEDAEASETLLDAMTALSEPGDDDDAEAWMARAEAYARCLVQLGAAMGRAVVTPEHAALAKAAARCGVVYKSCGAGGGDLGVALATDPERLRCFGEAAEAQGAHPLKLNIDRAGARARPFSGFHTPSCC